MQITYSDGKTEQLSIYEAIVRVVDFYGFEEIFKFKPQLRNESFLVKHLPYGQEKNYREIRSAQYVRVTGNYKDNLNILRLINIHFGKKLKIDLC